ncbi:hypothetical protein BDW72DRAFT_180128 [Aspergillus terricola var. indicus]
MSRQSTHDSYGTPLKQKTRAVGGSFRPFDGVWSKDTYSSATATVDQCPPPGLRLDSWTSGPEV